MGFFVLFPGEFQPLGKGPPLPCLSRCRRDRPAGLWRQLGLFHLIAGGCLGFSHHRSQGFIPTLRHLDCGQNVFPFLLRSLRAH